MVADEVLDTSVLVDLLRGFQPAQDWFALLGRQRAAITPVVWMETIAGATNQVKRAQTIRFLRQFRLSRGNGCHSRYGNNSRVDVAAAACGALNSLRPSLSKML